MNTAVERRAVNGHLITVVTVVRIMGAVAIIGLVGILILSFLGRPVPDLLAGIIGGALTGLPSLLARTESSQPVEKEKGNVDRP